MTKKESSAERKSANKTPKSNILTRTSWNETLIDENEMSIETPSLNDSHKII